MRHDPSHLWTAYWIALGLAVAGLLGLAPGVYEVSNHVRLGGDSLGVARWAYVLFFLGGVQLAYAVYVWQLADWSAVWMASGATLLLAATYATAVGFLMLSAEATETLAMLQLSENLRHRAVSWCFLMLSVNCLLTYLGGRAAVGWQRAHAQVLAARLRTSSLSKAPVENAGGSFFNNS